jgi:hypothetical protein
MSKVAHYYRCTSHCEKSTYAAYLANRNWADDFWKEMLLSEVAEDYFGEHDGWESDWPLDFAVFEDEECTQLIATGSVDIEMRPHFTACLDAGGAA